MQITFTFTTVNDTPLNYDSVIVVSFTDEDGKTKLLDCKDFADPKQRGEYFAEITKTLKEATLHAA